MRPGCCDLDSLKDCFKKLYNFTLFLSGKWNTHLPEPCIFRVCNLPKNHLRPVAMVGCDGCDVWFRNRRSLRNRPRARLLPLYRNRRNREIFFGCTFTQIYLRGKKCKLPKEKLHTVSSKSSVRDLYTYRLFIYLENISLLMSMICVSGAEDSANAADCILICTTEYRPLCASNNITYANDCERRAAACREKMNLTTLYEGECRGKMTQNQIKNYVITSTSPISADETLGICQRTKIHL